MAVMLTNVGTFYMGFDVVQFRFGSDNDQHHEHASFFFVTLF